MGGFSDFLFGSESKMKNFNPESLQQLLQMLQEGGGIEGNSLYGQGSNFLQNLFGNDPQFWQNFEQPYLNNFNENIAPGIAERFAGMGTGGGASSSSGLQNSLAQAGRGLQSDLASMRGNMQMQGLGQALQYAQQPQSNKLSAAGQVPQQYYERPGQGGFLQGATNAFAGGFGQGFGNKFGGKF
jgi:hypothetical protein